MAKREGEGTLPWQLGCSPKAWSTAEQALVPLQAVAGEAERRGVVRVGAAGGGERCSGRGGIAAKGGGDAA